MLFMRLQKQLSRKVGDKEYAKWVLVLPTEVVKSAGWKEGEELIVESKRNQIILKPK